MLNSKAYRLLDVGGTFVKCADGRQVPIPSDGSREEIAAALAKAVGPLDGVKGIGVAIPGPFDYREGVFRMERLEVSYFAVAKNLEHAFARVECKVLSISFLSIFVSVHLFICQFSLSSI